MDRQAPLYGAQARAALVEFFDALAVQTGAAVRIYPIPGAPQQPLWFCLQGTDDMAGGDTFLWSDGSALDPEAPARLDCVLDGAKNVDASTDADGDLMFTGLLFPMLEHDDWPPEDTSVTLAMLLAQRDDDESIVYARPGMAAEAFIRLAGGGNRQKVAALTTGQQGDEMHTFALSISDKSAYFDWSETDLAGALQAWLPSAVAACAEHDIGPPPRQPGGCEHLDVLFVVDGSLSMQDEQAALRGETGPPVFADFTDVLLTELDTLVDFHVGVISSDPDDVILHTHRDQPAVAADATTDCGLPQGQRWLVGPSATLEEDFACLASTMAVTHVETTALNAARALSHPANAGFVRDDSVLFVVIITDEDTMDDTTRVQIRQDILDAVGGDLSRLIVLAVAGDQGTFEEPKTTCWGVYGAAAPGRRLTSIVYSFREQGIVQDICEGDLASAFTAALADVVDTCENFHPEG